MTQPAFNWSREASLPVSGRTPLSRQCSAKAAQQASRTRGPKTREYLALLAQIGAHGVTDHDAARMLGLPLSSINSIRNGCGELVTAAGEGRSPYGRAATRWRIVE